MSRHEAPEITGDFAAVWTRVFTETVDWLRRKGFDRHTAEDAAQEAGARAIDRAIPFTSADDLTPWIRVVARRLACDANRSAARIGEDSADPVEQEDVATVVEWRLALAAAAEAFVRLSETDQAAIIEGVVGAQQADRRKAVRLAVRRHRARNRLLALLESVAPAVVVWARRLRRIAVPLAVGAGIVPILLVLPRGGTHTGTPNPQLVRETVRTIEPATRVVPVRSEPRRVATRDRPASDQAGPPPAGRAPVVTASIPGADGVAPPTNGFIRPKRDHEPLLCAGTPSTGTVCVKSPLDKSDP